MMDMALIECFAQADRFARGQMFFYLGIGLFVLAFLVIIVGVVMQMKKSKLANQEIADSQESGEEATVVNQAADED